MGHLAGFLGYGAAGAGFFAAAFNLTKPAFVPTTAGMKEATIEVRLSAEEKAVIRAAAEARGLSLSAFVRMAALDVAREKT